MSDDLVEMMALSLSTQQPDAALFSEARAMMCLVWLLLSPFLIEDLSELGKERDGGVRKIERGGVFPLFLVL